MRVLLTGGTGFVGINIVEKLLSEGIDVIIFALNRLVKEAEESFEKRAGTFTFIQGDIMDTDLLQATVEQYNITSIIHGAAITPDVNREIEESKTIVNVNCMGTVEVLELARRNNILDFIYLSSVSVYGETAYEENLLKEEQSIPKPETLYEITKFASERIAIRYKNLLNMNLVVLRIGHVFGPWEHYTGVRDTLSGPFQASRLAVLQEEAILSRPCKRDWVYSRDIANSIYSFLEKGTFENDIYHLGSGFQWSVEDWCKLLSEKYNDFSYSVSEQNANMNFHTSTDPAAVSVERLKTEIHYEPQYNLEKSFEDYMNWIENTSSFWIRK